MSNYNLIDAYLDNELSMEEKLSFEQQLSKDPGLRQELSLQQELIEGIREARKMELKAMLDAVAVGGSGMGNSISVGKFIAGIVLVGVVTWGVFYFTEQAPEREYVPVAENTSESLEDMLKVQQEETAVEEEAQPAEGEEPVQQQIAVQAEAMKDEQPVAETSNEVPAISQPDIRKPETIAAFEGGEEAVDSLHAPGSTRVEKKESSMSTIDVKVDNTKKKYTFHYQLKGGKLFLYGDFSSGLYEILEFNTNEGKSLFLYFKGKYYALDDNRERIVKLEPVRGRSLIEKLEEARGEN